MTAPDIYVALWRHKLFILLMTALLGAATWYLTSQQTKIYEASTLIRVQQSLRDAQDPIRSLDLGERLARTYAQIVKTRELSRRIADQLNSDVPLASIRGHVSADPVEDLELLWITARSPNPREAQQIANAAPPALRNFIEQKGTLREQILTVESAAEPSEPASPNILFNVTIAVMLGLLLNGALALLLEFLSDRLPKLDELEQAVDLPILARIPALAFTRAVPGHGPFSGNGAGGPRMHDHGAANESEISTDVADA